jgi:hypothetical protein
MKYKYVPQGELFILYEHPKYPGGHWKATAQLFYVMEESEEGDCISLHGDIYDMEVNFGVGLHELYFNLICGEPDEDEAPCLQNLKEWATRVCQLLDSPPDLWPIGD